MVEGFRVVLPPSEPHLMELYLLAVLLLMDDGVSYFQDFGDLTLEIDDDFVIQVSTA